MPHLLFSYLSNLANIILSLITKSLQYIVFYADSCECTYGLSVCEPASQSFSAIAVNLSSKYLHILHISSDNQSTKKMQTNYEYICICANALLLVFHLTGLLLVFLAADVIMTEISFTIYVLFCAIRIIE